MLYFFQWIVESSGGQLVAYHGTNAEFSAFDDAKIGTATDEGLLGRGFYFSTDPNVARSHKYRVTVQLSLSNPLRIPFPNWNANKKVLATTALGLAPESSAVDITQAARSKGYDGIILDYNPVNYGHQEIVVWSNGQIRILGREEVIRKV